MTNRQIGGLLKATSQSSATSVEGHATRTTKAKEGYAGFWMRLLAAVVDGIILQAAFLFIVFPIALSTAASIAGTPDEFIIREAWSLVGLVFGVLVLWLYFTISESSALQGTIGKKLLGLRVTDDRGRRINFGQANSRYWSKVVSTLILGIGFLMAGFTEKKQALHDQIAHTLVMRRSPSAAADRGSQTSAPG